jgi:hypothetical protein
MQLQRQCSASAGLDLGSCDTTALRFQSNWPPASHNRVQKQLVLPGSTQVLSTLYLESALQCHNKHVYYCTA